MPRAGGGGDPEREGGRKTGREDGRVHAGSMSPPVPPQQVCAVMSAVAAGDTRADRDVPNGHAQGAADSVLG
jgi:hypothetical protein